MKKQLDENQKRYNAVLKFFDTEFPVGGKLPEILHPSVEELRALTGNFHEKAVTEKVSRAGDTSDKNQNRRLVCMEGALLSKMLRSLAKKSGNVGLFDNSKFTRSSLRQMKESDLHYQCLEIYQTSTDYTEDLAKVGITDKVRAEMGCIYKHSATRLPKQEWRLWSAPV